MFAKTNKGKIIIERYANIPIREKRIIQRIMNKAYQTGRQETRNEADLLLDLIAPGIRGTNGWKIFMTDSDKTIPMYADKYKCKIIEKVKSIISARLFDSFKCSFCSSNGCDDGREHDRQLIKHIKKELDKLRGEK